MELKQVTQKHNSTILTVYVVETPNGRITILNKKLSGFKFINSDPDIIEGIGNLFIKISKDFKDKKDINLSTKKKTIIKKG